jgi:predicted nucleotidyltransferase component of viral defense system
VLTKPQLARFVHSSGLADPGFAENEVVLTYLLQLLVERGFIERVVFKGGTCIRKMLLGNRGRFSTDLDFTARTEVSDPDGEILALAEVLEEPFHEIQFRLDLGNEKEWRSAERTTWSVYPTYAHGLGNGSIKFEVSLRETPILEPAILGQLPQAYFTHLEFAPAALPCLHECELIAEKLRAAYQRRKARDVYDLAVFANRPRQEQLIRKALVLKLWNVRDSFDPAVFDARLSEKDRYDWDDLFELIPKRDREAPEALLGRVRRGFSFLAALTGAETELAADAAQRRWAEAEALRKECRAIARHEAPASTR